MKTKLNLRGPIQFIVAVAAVTLVLLVACLCARGPIYAWLEQYENRQVEHTAQQVMELLFEDPDWAEIYDLAGIQATAFEGRAEYVQYMEAKVGDAALECVETPAGLTGQYRYSIRLAGQELAAFTLEKKTDDDGRFAGWALRGVEACFTRNKSVTVNIMPGCTVYINGVPLDDSYTTLRVTTPAEDFLPEGVHGFRYEQQRITGLLVEPQITVLDQYNMPMTLQYDEAAGLYTVPIQTSSPMTGEERELILSAARADALYAVRGGSLTALRQHFNTASDIYKQICEEEALMTGGEIFEFDEEVTAVTGYYSYTEKLFSARVQLRLKVTDGSGQVTALDWEYTYLFTANNAEQFLVTDRTELDLQQQIETQP